MLHCADTRHAQWLTNPKVDWQTTSGRGKIEGTIAALLSSWEVYSPARLLMAATHACRYRTRIKS